MMKRLLTCSSLFFSDLYAMASVLALALRPGIVFREFPRVLCCLQHATSLGVMLVECSHMTLPYAEAWYQDVCFAAD